MSSLVVFESAELEQRGGRLTFCKIFKFVVYYTATFARWHWPCSTCGVASQKPEVKISRSWWRLTVLGWSSLETSWYFLSSEAFILGHSFFSHWHWPLSRCGVASRKPEVEISGRWWRLRVPGWNNLKTSSHFIKVWGFYFRAQILFPIDIGRVRTSVVCLSSVCRLPATLVHPTQLL